MGKTQPKTRSKKAWRKVDTSEVEAYEEAKREDKTAGVATLQDDALFFVDKAGAIGGQKDLKRRKRAGVDTAPVRKRKDLETSEPETPSKRSKVEADGKTQTKAASKKGKASKKGEAQEAKAQEPRKAIEELSTNENTQRVRLLRARKAKQVASHNRSVKEAAERKTKRADAALAPPPAPTQEVLHDLWGNDSFQPNPKELARRKSGDYLVRKEGLKPAHAGSSFNPAEEARLALVQKAYDRDLAERQAAAEMHRKLRGEIEINYNLFPESADPEPQVSQPVVEKRKTRQQINKQKRHRIRQKEIDAKKTAQALLKQVDRLPTLLKSIRKEEREREKMKLEIEAKKAANPKEPKLGKHVYQESFPEVVLADEVKEGSLLNVPASKQVVADQFERFQAKRLIEPRKYNGKTHKAHPVRWANKRSLADDIA